MFKKFLSGVLAAALLLGGATYANTTTADAAAKVPAPKYNFNMDKATKNVVARMLNLELVHGQFHSG